MTALGVWILVFYFVGATLLGILGSTISLISGLAYMAFQWIVGDPSRITLLTVASAIAVAMLLSRWVKPRASEE